MRDQRADMELAARLKSRLESLRSVREPWEPVWRDLCDYLMPRKNSFGGGRRAAGGDDELIYDSTPTHGLEQLASGLGGLLTNPSLPWFGIRTRDPERAELPGVREYLGRVRERMVRLFNTEGSGFQANVHELYLDIVLFGTAVMYVEADPDTAVRFSTRPLGEICVGENARGVVDTVFRQYELTARQAVDEWGEDCSERVRALADERPEDKVDIVHAVFPRRDRDPAGFTCADFPWACVYLEAESGHVLEESGYLEMPYMAPRWSKAAGEVYGRGPGLTALSDVRVLSAMGRTALMAAEKMSDPPLMVPDDGFLGPVNTGPGGLSYYRAGSSDRIEALPVAVDLRAAEDMMAARRESVRRIFLADQFSPEGPGKTATEAVIRQSEKMRMLGPVLGRMQTEFLSPLIHRVFRILLRAGELPALPSGLRAADLEVEYLSPVARAQKQYEARSLLQMVEYLAPFTAGGDPFGVMDNFRTDRIARHAAEMFGTPGDYLRTEDEVRAVRSARQGADKENGEAAAGTAAAGGGHAPA